MVCVLAATNLIEILAVITITSISFLNFFLIYILKLLVARSIYAKNIRHDSRFSHYENGFMFWITWFGACFFTALLFSISFSEIYNTPDVVDGAPYILSLYVVYLALMTLWVLVQYVWPRQSNKFAFFLIFLVYLVSVFNIVLVFRLPESHWEHYLVLLLLVPPTFAIIATNIATTFRVDILHTIHVLGSTTGHFFEADQTAKVYQQNEKQPASIQSFKLGGTIPMGVDFE